MILDLEVDLDHKVVLTGVFMIISIDLSRLILSFEFCFGVEFDISDDYLEDNEFVCSPTFLAMISATTGEA